MRSCRSLLVTSFLLASCSAKLLVPSSAPLQLSPSRFSLGLGSTQLLTASGGKAPYRFSMSPASAGQLDAFGLFTPNWAALDALLTVTDSSGSSVATPATLLPSAIRINNGIATTSQRLFSQGASAWSVLGATNNTLGTELGAAGNGTAAFVGNFSTQGGLNYLSQFSAGINLTFGTYALSNLGDAILVGTTTGTNCGNLHNGHSAQDLCVVKFSADGSSAWAGQLGATGAVPTNYEVEGFTFSSLDASGNLFIASAVLTFGTTPSLGGAVYGTGISGGGFADSAFLTRFSPTGALDWIAQIGSGTVFPEQVSPTGFYVDNSGNSYLLLAGTGDLGGNHYGNGGSSAFIGLMKFDANGNLLFTSQVNANGYTAGGNPYVNGAGEILWGNSLGSNVGGTQIGSGPGSQDFVISSHQADGTLKWLDQLGGGGTSNTQGSISPTATTLYAVGTTEGNIGGSQNGTQGARDLFVALISQNTGNLQWARQFGAGGTHSVSVNSSLIDVAQNIIVCGTVDGDLGLPFTGTSGAQNGYVVKYDTLGNLSWGRQLGDGPGGQLYIDQISFDSLGNVYVLGHGDGLLSGNVLGEQGTSNVFVLKLNAQTGAVLWSQNLGVSGASLTPSSLFLDEDNNAYLEANMSPVATPSFASYSLGPGSGSSSALIFKLDSQGNVQ